MMVVVGVQAVEIGLNAGIGGASARPFPPQPDRPAIILPPVSSHWSASVLDTLLILDCSAAVSIQAHISIVQRRGHVRRSSLSPR